MRRRWFVVSGVMAMGMIVASAQAEAQKKPPREGPRAKHVDRERAMDRLREKIEALERRRDELTDKKGLKEDHPEIRELDENVERLEGELEEMGRRGRHPGPPEADRDRAMDRLRERIEALERRRDELIDRKGIEEDDPRIRELDENIERLERELEWRERGEHRRGPGPVGRPHGHPPSPEILEKLEAIIPEIAFDEVPLAEVMNFLREAKGLNIHVAWRALEMIDVDRETPVTVGKLTKIPTEMALRFVLRSVEEEPGQIDFYVDRNVVVVTTREGMPKGEPPRSVMEFLERLRHELPEVHEHLMRLRRLNPGQYHRELADMGRMLPPPEDREREMELEELRRRDPERVELVQRDATLNDRTVELAERIREMKESPERGKLMGELRDRLNEQFDVRMKIRKRELEELEQRIGELTATLKRRAKNKQALVERRMRQLLNPDETNW